MNNISKLKNKYYSLILSYVTYFLQKLKIGLSSFYIDLGFSKLPINNGTEPQNLTEMIKKHRLLDNPVTFVKWPGPHAEIYDIDDDYSHTEPELVKKGIIVSMILEGVITVDTHIDQLHLDVYWNRNLFHSEDHKLDDNIQEQEPYELKFSWFVPGFAPSGNYFVDLFLRSSGQELGCERAIFSL